MPNDYMQHRINQYGQHVCYTNKFIADCRKRNITERFTAVNNVLCRCPSSQETCRWMNYTNHCRSDYEFPHYRFPSKEVNMRIITYTDKKTSTSYHCPCPPNPCASEAFYNQCRDYESKNMHGLDVGQARLTLHPSDYPQQYPETARLLGLPEVNCYCPPTTIDINSTFPSLS
ncbi:hypothetical protein Sant_3505 [Sodalis praecaptivus]|uniref:Uncharacterized protein n=1 Tax=Sodalis praecaptivus TaxID=1239307 RepID=W0I159_9GAMM|nr:hypothetical protein Sant_3505 [Sodalis praecaptivus]